MKNLIKLLAAILVFLLVLCFVLPQTRPFPLNPSEPTGETKEMASTGESTEAPTETVTPTETVLPTETIAPTETVAPTEPPAATYLLSFAGDCTFADNFTADETTWGTFTKVVGDNFAYPFAKVKSYFEADDLSLINLEFAFTTYEPTEEEILALKLHEKTYRFRSDAKYTQVLHEGDIEFVSAANNHSLDYGWPGHAETQTVLTNAGIRFATWGSNCLMTTESGLTVGIYAASFSFSMSNMKTNIAKLRNAGADIVICSIHWGIERTYHPTDDQQAVAHLAIDSGADIVFGHHPHVLQPIEYYNGGLIMYSMGNFSFGGNRNPVDKDTAIIQQQIQRWADGTITLGETIIVPCSMSSSTSGNNFQPRPYTLEEEGYQRVLSKLDWSYANQWQAEQDAATAPTETTDPTQTGDATEST